MNTTVLSSGQLRLEPTRKGVQEDLSSCLSERRASFASENLKKYPLVGERSKEEFRSEKK
jgi:hypothetical protein